ncbi:hypothetical protein GW17_00013810 [Ensete ventricosum]|nr:hypothetical protein GW17_00013810 [Ensete ventricosum]
MRPNRRRMPEMRSGVGRDRVQTNPVVQAELPSTRRRRAARTHQPADDNPLLTRSAERRKGIGLVEGRGKVGGFGREENSEESGRRRRMTSIGGRPP